MNDLPQNELFSAYLDGELSAAEQADMEQLLATSPAARQLLEELRVLSTTLQSLPQEKLGEDFGPRVLRVAERRMLTGEESGMAEDAPVPLVRSVFRRFLNRRSLAWVGLATAIAVVISINEWQQDAGPIGQVVREVALAPRLVANNRIAPEAEEPLAMRAAHDRDEMSPEEERMGMLVLEEDEALMSTLADEPISLGLATKSPAKMPAKSMRSVAKKGFEINKRGAFAGKTSGTARGREEGIASFGGLKAEQGEKAGLATEGVLVVRCDISLEAVERKSLEKLLEANGVTWQERTDRSSMFYKIKEKGVNENLVRSDTTDQLNLVWVEATPAQIEATLAGLVAQPDVFLTFSLNPPQNELPKDVVEQFFADGKTLRDSIPGNDLFQFQQSVKVAGPTAGPGVVGQLDMEVGRRMSQSKADKPQSAVMSVEDKRQAGFQVQEQQSAPAAPRQRVLFVLRVVDQQEKHPVAATEAESGVEAAAPIAKPSAPANLPAVEK